MAKKAPQLRYVNSENEDIFMKRWIVGLALVLLCLSLFACADSAAPDATTAPVITTAPTQPNAPPEDPDPVPQVRILNTDSNMQRAWEYLAEEYSRSTGTEVLVVSSPEDATLLTVTSRDELPESCADLSGSAACAQLMARELTLTNDQGQVLAVANHIEVYGLVFNSTLLAQTAHTREDINSFAQLTEVVYAISDNADTLGFSAFARVDPDVHFAIQLATLTGDTRNLVELILNNTTCDPLTLKDGTKTEALQDFLEGRAVFFLAGSREQEALAAIGSENMGVLPVYTGEGNEENLTLCVAPRSYWCVNAGADALDVEATLAFLDYLTTARGDGTVPVDDLMQMSPFRQATYTSNIPEQVLRSDVALGRVPVVCRYIEQVPEGLTEALISYAANPSDDNWSMICQIIRQ